MNNNGEMDNLKKPGVSKPPRYIDVRVDEVCPAKKSRFNMISAKANAKVQSDHFEELSSVELDKHGYEALFKRRTNEFYSGNVNTIDGCATFFRRDRFAHVKKYEDNVALIAVLEVKFGGDNPVANTHVNVPQLWQVHTLLKGLEKIAASADIPMLVSRFNGQSSTDFAPSCKVNSSTAPGQCILILCEDEWGSWPGKAQEEDGHFDQ